MKNTVLCLATSSLMLASTLGIVADAYASSDIQLVTPPEEQQYYQMSNSGSNENSALSDIQIAAIDAATQAKIEAKKNSILDKIAQLKNSAAGKASYTANNGNTMLGKTPSVLYSYARLLDYSPHPRTESILKDKPVLFKGKNYHFDVTYKEDWKDVTATEARITGLCFTFDVFENGKKVRTLTTPKVTISSKKIKKGQTIGIAEVSPFKFNVKVDSLVSDSKGVSELTFKLDLIG